MKNIATTFVLITALTLLSACGKDESAVEIAATTEVATEGAATEAAATGTVGDGDAYTEQADGSFTGIENDVIDESHESGDGWAQSVETVETKKTWTGRYMCTAFPIDSESFPLVGSHMVSENPRSVCSDAIEHCNNQLREIFRAKAVANGAPSVGWTTTCTFDIEDFRKEYK